MNESEAVARALEIVMSEISEQTYCAGWMSGLGEDLWRIVQMGGGSYRLYTLTEGEAAMLRTLARLAGGWWAGYREFVPLAEWEAMMERSPA